MPNAGKLLSKVAADETNPFDSFPFAPRVGAFGNGPAFREASVRDVEMEALPDGSRVPSADTPRRRALLEGFRQGL